MWALFSSGCSGPVYTMDREVGPWKMAFLGLSLGVNRMYNKRNDHVPKTNVLSF